MFNGRITDAGAALIAQWATGSALTITGAAAGDGRSTNLAVMTNLTHRMQTAAITRYKVENNAVTMKLSIGAAESAYTMTQMGIFGKIGNGTETLIAVYQDDIGVEIPSQSLSADFSFTLYAVISASGSGTLNVTIDSGSALTQDDLAAELVNYAKKDVATATKNGLMSAADKTFMTSIKNAGHLADVSASGTLRTFDTATASMVDTGVKVRGEDGVSPTISFEKSGNNIVITVDDADGSHTYTVSVGSITGVSVNGTSISSSGNANIPAASETVYGATKLGTTADTAAKGNHSHGYDAIEGAPGFRLDGTDLYITL